MLLCALGSVGTSFVVGFFAAKVAAGLSRTLRELQFDKTLSFSMEEINKFSTASLITRSTNDITQIQTLVAMGLQAIIKAPILAVWAIIKIAGKSWQWTAATGLAVIALMIVIAVVIIFAVPKFKKVQKQTDKINQVTRENLTGLRVVRAYNAEGYQEEKFEQANEELTKTNLFTNRIMALLSPTMTLVMSGLTLAVYWIGAYLILSLIHILILKYTIFGRGVYAIGGNREAAILSGVRVKLFGTLVWTISGALAGYAGIMTISWLTTAQPTIMDGAELDAIAAAVIGGTSMTGGKGGMIGTFAGVILLAIITNIFNLLGLQSYWQQIFKGIIIAVSYTHLYRASHDRT